MRKRSRLSILKTGHIVLALGTNPWSQGQLWQSAARISVLFLLAAFVFLIPSPASGQTTLTWSAGTSDNWTADVLALKPSGTFTVSDLGSCSANTAATGSLSCTTASLAIPSGTTDLAATMGACASNSGGTCQATSPSSASASVSLSDSCGHTWTIPGGSSVVGSSQSIGRWEALGVLHAPAAQSCTFTVTWTASSSTYLDYSTVHVLAVSGTAGLDTSSPGWSSGTGTSLSAITGTLSASGDFVVGTADTKTSETLTAGQTKISGNSFLTEWTTGPTIGGTVANPSISPASGTYSSPQTITVSDSTSGATICVRTDGGTPTANTPGTCDSPATGYSSGSNFSLTIPSGGATVKALGTLASYTNSAVVTNTYSLSTATATLTWSFSGSDSWTADVLALKPSGTFTVSDLGSCSANTAATGSLSCTTSSLAIPSGTTDLVATMGTCASNSGGSCQTTSPSSVSASVSLSDSCSHSWTIPGGSSVVGSSQSMGHWEALGVLHAPATQACTFTVTWTASSGTYLDYSTVHVLAVSGTAGLDTGSPAWSSATSSSPAATTGTLSASGEFVVGTAATKNSEALTAGQTKISGSTFLTEWTTGPTIGGSGPSVSSVSPPSGSVGTSVTISGSNFGSSQGTSTVTFGATLAGTATTWSPTSIAIPVPSGAPVGSDPVVVTVAGVSSNSDKTFTVTAPPAPNIASLSPNTGPATTLVTITGTNFGSTQQSSTVTFGGIATNPISWSSTTIVAPVPAGAQTGNVIVTVGGVASNGKMFTVPTGTNVYYYLDDMLGSARVITTSAGAVCYDADFYPFGGERVVTDTGSCEQDYKFTGKERDSESGLDNFGARYDASSMGRFMSPDPAGMFAVRLAYPQTLNRYSYVLNNPLSLADPLGLDCAYLNNAGNGIESVDQNSSAGECGTTGGYWVTGTLTQASINANATMISLQGTTNGADVTSASYQQNTTLDVGWYQNTLFNPFGHIALGIGNNTPVGLNPSSDADYLLHLGVDLAGSCVANSNCYNAPYDALSRATVPGAILPQSGAGATQNVVVPITGMQATLIQNAINQSTQSPPPYSIFGPSPACDCGTWAQQMMNAGGVQSGAPAPIPQDLMKQLSQTYGPR